MHDWLIAICKCLCCVAAYESFVILSGVDGAFLSVVIGYDSVIHCLTLLINSFSAALMGPPIGLRMIWTDIVLNCKIFIKKRT